jgi:altronate hydrolase
MGHKIAVRRIEPGEPVRKYGQIIGQASQAIEAGQWVHCHNVALGEFERDYAPATEVPPPQSPIVGRSFMGYRRANGKAGTRNYVAVISTVNCSASVSKYIARRFDDSILKDFPNVDGVIGITHAGGCAMQYGGEGHQMLARVLGGVAKHPNVGAFLLIGLGCETGAMGYLLEQERLVQIEGTSGQRAKDRRGRRPQGHGIIALGERRAARTHCGQ